MIRKTLTSVCAALALAGGLVAPVAAKAIATDSVFFVSTDFGDGLDTFAAFGDSFATKGTAFDDVFLFFAPPVESQIEFDVAADYLKGATVRFTGFDFGYFNGFTADGVDVTSLPTGASYLTKFALGGESASHYLNSGIYFVEVTGVSKADGGGFSGNFNTTAIPEPDSLALMLAGVGLLGTMVRRRKQNV